MKINLTKKQPADSCLVPPPGVSMEEMKRSFCDQDIKDLFRRIAAVNGAGKPELNIVKDETEQGK